jgi:hypothetical protein
MVEGGTQAGCGGGSPLSRGTFQTNVGSKFGMNRLRGEVLWPSTIPTFWTTASPLDQHTQQYQTVKPACAIDAGRRNIVPVTNSSPTPFFSRRNDRRKNPTD